MTPAMQTHLYFQMERLEHKLEALLCLARHRENNSAEEKKVLDELDAKLSKSAKDLQHAVITNTLPHK